MDLYQARQMGLCYHVSQATAHVQGLFNFKPSVRPVPLEAHIQVGFRIPGSSEGDGLPSGK